MNDQLEAGNAEAQRRPGLDAPGGQQAQTRWCCLPIWHGTAAGAAYAEAQPLPHSSLHLVLQARLVGTSQLPACLALLQSATDTVQAQGRHSLAVSVLAAVLCLVPCRYLHCKRPFTGSVSMLLSVFLQAPTSTRSAPSQATCPSAAASCQGWSGPQRCTGRSSSAGTMCTTSRSMRGEHCVPPIGRRLEML